MDLFSAKLKQNRLYARNKGRRLFIAAPLPMGSDVLNRLAGQTRSIVAIHMASGASIDAGYLAEQGFHTVCVGDGASLAVLDSWFAGAEPEQQAPASPSAHEPLWGFLAELNDKAEAFLVNDMLIQCVPRHFLLNGVVKGDASLYFPLFTDVLPRRPLGKGSRTTAIVADWFFGYGDSLMAIPLLQDSIDRRRSRGEPVHVLAREKTVPFLRKRLNHCSVLGFMDSYHMYEAITKSDRYVDVILLSLRLTAPKLHHVVELWAQALGDPQLLNRYARTGTAVSPADSLLAEEAVRLRQQYKALIGFQHHTGEAARCWPQRHAEHFAQHCMEAGIGLIPLSPTAHPLPCATDWSRLPLDRALSAVPLLDAVVGIDSVFGHAAALAGIPNLTIWGKNVPHLQKNSPSSFSFLSFRPLYMNYSMVPESNRSEDITPDHVFQRLIEMLDGHLPLKQSRITIEDTLNGFHIEWVKS
ncbi:hypothetical protein DNH61_06390 [Paenibacillus sambharensis]|uniref:ADP-heptose:LPS heptosyltransferase n=1 Tax=Paenibacillus sambharensis TaxID=1803190 RepID=A0A2W1LPH2_9BACL|nr:hypothetical protein [Paenibacillus sambharensis]PZD96822.1 hypothetical protein DNH61_06390 [Paenibacillus sambharensis]